MEGGGGASGGGRYEEKGGGQQVGSLFAEATDNEKIKAIYGNYNLWSWLRYWYLDTENYVTFMLLDKGYYDYDYEAVKETVRRNETQEQKDKRTQKMMDRFGFGKVKSIKKTLTPEELQAEVMREEKKK
jgi:hypothetical protein